MKIKVCGITEYKQLQKLDEIGVDYAGFIFHPASPRYIRNKEDVEMIGNFSGNISKTGVFLDETEDVVLDCITDFGLNVVQLHGNESPEYCSRMKKMVQVIKVFGVRKGSIFSPEDLNAYADACDYFLFDTHSENLSGGTGKKFNWELLRDVVRKPFFLSGGIAPEDVEELLHFEHPYLLGVDINSRFEITPGIKDMKKVASFVQQIKSQQLKT